MSKRVSPNSAEFTETDIWNHLKIEQVSRTTVSKSYGKMKNEPKFDPEQNLNKIDKNIKSKLNNHRNKISIRFALFT